MTYVLVPPQLYLDLICKLSVSQDNKFFISIKYILWQTYAFDVNKSCAKYLYKVIYLETKVVWLRNAKTPWTFTRFFEDIRIQEKYYLLPEVQLTARKVRKTVRDRCNG